MSDPIGYLIISEPTVFTRHGETACNYDLIEVPAGEYPVTACNHIRGMVRASLPGTLTRTHYVNRLFSSSSVHDAEPMTPANYFWRVYDFQWSEMVKRGEARKA
jgi:hypothetical protein